MTKDIERKIDDLIEQGYDFPVMDFFRNAYALFRKSTGSFIGFFLLMMLISVFASSIPYLGSILNSFIIGPVLVVGFYLYSDKLIRDQRPEFDSFFKGFDHVVQLMLVAVTTSLIYLLILSPAIYMIYKSGLIEWYMEVMENPLAPPAMPALDLSSTDFTILILNIIPVIYFTVAFLWAPLFVVFNGMPFWDAMEASRRVITREWFSVFSFFLLFMSLFILLSFIVGFIMALIPVLGIILGVVGMIGAVLVLVPVLYIATYISFAEVTGLREEKSEDILDHLIN